MTGPTRSYAHVLQAVTEQPWAIRPAMLEVIVDLVHLRVAGGHLTEEEISARVGAAPASRPQQSVGAIAVIPIYGVIVPKAGMMSDMSGGTSLVTFLQQFRSAMASDRVRGILLDVDSPGGRVDLLPETAAEIRAAREVKPIYAIANTQAASGGYWLAAQATELIVTPSGQVGSIGVRAAHEDLSKADEMAGVKTTLISAGKYKTELSDTQPLSDEARAAVQRTVDAFYDMFVNDVARGRGVSAMRVHETFGEGRMVLAADALQAGMVDRVETFDDVVLRLTRGAGGSRSGAFLEEHDQVATAFDPYPVPTGSPSSRAFPLRQSWDAMPPASPIAGAIPSHGTATVDEPWDGSAEVAKIPNDAGEAVLRRMYAWVDGGQDPDTKGAYKLPHHKVVNGSPGPANVRGVNAAKARLAQPDTNIPAADQDAVRAHLQRHQDDAKKAVGDAMDLQLKVKQ
jgi:signal peptide peptidase SppA